MKPTRVIKRWPIRLQNGRGVTEAGRTKDGSSVFRIKGSTKFGRWSKPARSLRILPRRKNQRRSSHGLVAPLA